MSAFGWIPPSRTLPVSPEEPAADPGPDRLVLRPPGGRSTGAARRRLLLTPAILALATAWTGAGGVSAQTRAGDPLRSQQWYLDAVRAPGPAAGVSAAGTRVAVLDTGVDAQHEDLGGVVDLGPDLVPGPRGEDLNGHGTHVAGLIAAKAENGSGIQGVAPGARVLSIRVLDAQERGNTQLVADGLDAAVAAGSKVINLSLSPGSESARTLTLTDPLVMAMQRAVDAGVVVVAAAGNFAMPLCAQPVLVTGILCVAAVNRRLALASYSNFGFRVDVVAPGGDADDGLVSSVPGDRYAAYAGTSQATPLAAGLAALLVAKGLPAETVIQRIKQTARDLGTGGEDLQFGHGLIDVAAAAGVELRQSDPASEERPSALLTLSVPPAVRTTTLLRSGLPVRCRSTLMGRCLVEVRDEGSVLARGSRNIRSRTPSRIQLRLTARGRRFARRASNVRVTIAARGPRGSTAMASVLVRRQASAPRGARP